MKQLPGRKMFMKDSMGSEVLTDLEKHHNSPYAFTADQAVLNP
jgi:hypothetical protein